MAPTATADAPAIINSMASSAVAIPPMPMTGIETACAACQTMRTATGLIAGPDRPPVLLASTNCRLSISIFAPVIVLIREIASAPPASAARAICVISVTLGVSFMITGWAASFLMRLVMS